MWAPVRPRECTARPIRCRSRERGCPAGPRPRRAAGRSCGVSCGQLGPGGSWLGQQVGEHCARIRHGLVEKRGEQVVRQVIVHGYIAPGLISAVVWPTRSKGRRDRPQPVQRARYQLVHRPCQHGQHPRELLRRPFAGHVGLAEADQAVAPDPACKCVRPMDEQAGCARIGGTCCRSVGVDHRSGK